MKQHFGMLLKEIRKDLNLTQVEFCKKVGILQGTLSKLENQQMTTNTDVLINVTRSFAKNPKIREMLLDFLFNEKPRSKRHQDNDCGMIL